MGPGLAHPDALPREFRPGSQQGRDPHRRPRLPRVPAPPALLMRPMEGRGEGNRLVKRARACMGMAIATNRSIPITISNSQ